jgi:hypothetical protein
LVIPISKAIRPSWEQSPIFSLRAVRLCGKSSFLSVREALQPSLPVLSGHALPATVGNTVSRNHGRKIMILITIVAVFGLLLVGLVLWVLIQNTQDQKKSQQMESQMNELRRDLLNLSITQAQSSTKLETIAGTVATRLEAVTTALKDGVKDSAQITSKLTAESQAAMSLEL